MDRKHMDAFLEQALDDRKVFLFCEEHGYIGGPGRPPHSGCKSCWMAYFVGIVAKTPPHLRERKLMELETIVYKLKEDIDAGRHDFEIFEHPVVNIERNVSDEEIEREKSKDISEE